MIISRQIISQPQRKLMKRHDMEIEQGEMRFDRQKAFQAINQRGGRDDENEGRKGIARFDCAEIIQQRVVENRMERPGDDLQHLLLNEKC